MVGKGPQLFLFLGQSEDLFIPKLSALEKRPKSRTQQKSFTYHWTNLPVQIQHPIKPIQLSRQKWHFSLMSKATVTLI